MEESLREAACLGDLAAVTKLIEAGVNVNSANKINGWTGLHWACRRGHLVIIKLLLRYGADVNLLTHKGESAADLARSMEVLELVSSNAGSVTIKPTDPLPIIPHYLKHQEFPYSKRREELLNDEVLSHGMDYDNCSTGYKRKTEQHNIEHVYKKMNSNDNLIVKCRIAGSEDDDFIEVEVAALTFANLLHCCCEELQINSDNVYKLRKLPNVVIRNDKDVLRLVPYQEIEIVLK